MEDNLGDRMKSYEKTFTKARVGGEFIYARIDGRGFSKFTKGMEKPFDNDFQLAMISTTESLVRETHALVGYTQSDEISLLWNKPNGIMFDGKIQKLASVLSGIATSRFIIDGAKRFHPNYLKRYPHFDARIFELPDEEEVANAFLWRYQDAYRNAIQMIGQANYSPKQLHKKSVKDIEKMLLEDHDIDVGDYESRSKFGTFIVRNKVEKTGADGAIVMRDALDRVSFAFGHPEYSIHNDRKKFIFNR